MTNPETPMDPKVLKALCSLRSALDELNVGPEDFQILLSNSAMDALRLPWNARTFWTSNVAGFTMQSRAGWVLEAAQLMEMWRRDGDE